MSETLPRLAARPASPDALVSARNGAPRSAEGEAAVALVDLHGLRAAARRQLWVIVAAAAVGVMAAGWLIWRSTPTYTATATIRLADSRRALAGDLVGKASDDGSMETDPVLTEMQVLLSRSVAARVATGPLAARLRLRLSNLPISALADLAVDSTAVADSVTLDFGASGVTAHSGRRSVQAPYGRSLSISGVTFTVPARPATTSAALHIQSLDQTVQRLVRGTTAVRRPGTNIVDVTYRGSIPDVVQQSANSVAMAFQEVNRESVIQKSLQRREFLGQRVAQTDSLLQSARDSLSAFQSSPRAGAQTWLVRGGGGGGGGSTAAAVGRGQVVETRAQLQAMRDLVRRLESAIATGDGAAVRVALASVPAGTANPVIDELAMRVGAMRDARDSLTSGRWARAETHPDVVRLDTMLQAAGQELLAAARGQQRLLEEQDRGLTESARREQAALAGLPRLQLEEQRLTERTTTLERLAQELREEYQRAQIEEAAASGDVQLVDTAMRPVAADGVSPLRQLLFGLLLGLGVGVGLAYLLEQLDTTLRGEEDLEEHLGVTSLGAVPSFTAAARAGRRHLPWLHRRRRLRKRGLPSVVQRQNSPADAGWAAGDAFRALHTNLLFADPQGMPRSLVVTSAVAGEGKTTVAINLAICMAQYGGRVLLLDGDLRRPQLHAAFGVPREHGLTELVHDDRPWSDVVHSTQFDGLSLLTAGRATGRESGLLRSISIRRGLMELMQAFDVVIIDAPPVLYTADAAIISAVVEGVVLVTSAGVTDRSDGRTAVRMLRQVGANVLGGVLNDPDARLRDHHYERYGYQQDLLALASRS